MSKAVERGILYYLDEGKVFDRKAKGRGEPTFVKVKPANEETQPKRTTREEARAQKRN